MSSKRKKSKQNAYKYQTNEKVLVLPKVAGEDIYEAKVDNKYINYNYYFR